MKTYKGVSHENSDMEDLQRRLDTHQERRERSLPVVTVLTGAFGAFDTLRNYLTSWAIWTPACAKTLLATWLLTVLTTATSGTSTQSRLECAISVECDEGLALLPHRLIEAIAAGLALECMEAESLLQPLPMQQDVHIISQIFAALMALDPLRRMPGLLIAIPGNAEHTSVMELLTLAVRIAERVPRLPIAVTLGAGQFERYLETPPESRYKAILREGLIRIVPEDNHDDHVLFEQLTHLGASSPVLHEAVALLNCLRLRNTLDASLAARSQAERFLFSLLESLPEFRGKFRLNARLAVMFGHQPLEVDLLANPPGVAVEIDGYFHFQDPDRYRRDRRKDLILQQQGFLVIRFLAEDVVSDLGSILDRLRAALRHRSITFWSTEDIL